MAKLTLNKISAANYKTLVAGGTVDKQTIYWLDDGTIYVAGKKYGGDVEVVSSFPTVSNAEMNTIYINSTDLSAKISNGTALVEIAKGYTTEITASSTDDVVPTAKAVADYITTKIASLPTAVGVTNVASKEGAVLEVTKDGTASDVTLEGVVYEPTWDSAEYKLTLPIAGEDDLVINFAKDSVVRAGKYVANEKEIWLSIDEDGWYDNEDKVIKIPVEELVDVYTGATTNSVKVSVSDSNVITANVKVSSETDNALSVKTEGNTGLYVDISGKADKLSGDLDGEVVLADGNGGIKTTGHTIGGASLSTSAPVQVLATESAVKGYADTVADSALASAKEYADSLITWVNF